jgi:eukaryotic-like serine/threonine-protein kinase
MSPEQARGHSADQRSDIFSFGCVLYEMLTGRETFQGETVTDLIASVVAREPDFTALPTDINPKMEDVLRRCLAKDRKERWHAIADVRVELKSIVADPHGLTLRTIQNSVVGRPLWKRAVAIAITAIL